MASLFTGDLWSEDVGSRLQGKVFGLGPGRLQLEASRPANAFMGFELGRLELPGIGFRMCCLRFLMVSKRLALSAGGDLLYEGCGFGFPGVFLVGRVSGQAV